MCIYDIVCGECGSHEFKSIEGKNTCSSCGYILIDKNIESILEQAYLEHQKLKGCNNEVNKI